MIRKIGFWSALFTTLLTLVTFGIAIFTPPLSGPFCVADCFQYPYSDIADRFPRDYYWMYPALLLVLVFYVLMTAIHFIAPKDKKILSHIGLSFALITTVILIVDYVLQISVIQPSILKGETEGIALLTQYNAHGIFIALEEIGFVMMSLSMLFMAPIFTGSTWVDKGIKWVFILSFVLTLLALITLTAIYGIFREYRFEVAAISINWIALILSRMLLSIFFRRIRM